MSQYYIMDSNLDEDNDEDDVEGYMEIEDWVGIKGFEGWRHGEVARQRPDGPVEIRVTPHDGHIDPPGDLHDSNVPLMSARLKVALESAGVDNIFFFPVNLRNSSTNQTYEYFAFNLLGLVSVTNLANSDISSYDGDFVGDSEIHDLALDASKCHDLQIFRLKEKFSAIVVHRQIKEAIERAGILSHPLVFHSTPKA